MMKASALSFGLCEKDGKCNTTRSSTYFLLPSRLFKGSETLILVLLHPSSVWMTCIT